MNRDNEIDTKLDMLGWVVLHFWGKDIQKNLNDCVKEVKNKIIEIMAERYHDEYIDYGQTESEYLIASETTPEYNSDTKE
jgi:very-short-patch-repair endonuclease